MNNIGIWILLQLLVNICSVYGAHKHTRVVFSLQIRSAARKLQTYDDLQACHWNCLPQKKLNADYMICSDKFNTTSHNRCNKAFAICSIKFNTISHNRCNKDFAELFGYTNPEHGFWSRIVMSSRGFHLIKDSP